MRPNRLEFSLKGQGQDCFSVVGTFPKLNNFVEGLSSRSTIANTNTAIPSFEIMHDTWVQFVPNGWSEMTSTIAEEMVECWNERYSDDKYSPMREEVASFKSYAWQLESLVESISTRPDCPDAFRSAGENLFSRLKEQAQLDWDTSQTKIKHLEAELSRYKEIIKKGE